VAAAAEIVSKYLQSMPGQTTMALMAGQIAWRFDAKIFLVETNYYLNCA
jgi:hypothetical protein